MLCILCYWKAGLKMSCVMLLQNEKLVVDEFLEKVAAASRKVRLTPNIAFPCLLAALCSLPLAAMTLPFNAFLLPFAICALDCHDVAFLRLLAALCVWPLTAMTLPFHALLLPFVFGP